MPQLDIFILCSLVIFTTLTLLSLIFFMHTYIVPKIAVSLKTRNFLTIIGEKSKVHQNTSKLQTNNALTNLHISLLKAIKNRIKKI